MNERTDEPRVAERGLAAWCVCVRSVGRSIHLSHTHTDTQQILPDRQTDAQDLQDRQTDNACSRTDRQTPRPPSSRTSVDLLLLHGQRVCQDDGYFIRCCYLRSVGVFRLQSPCSCLVASVLVDGDILRITVDLAWRGLGSTDATGARAQTARHCTRQSSDIMTARCVVRGLADVLVQV